MANTAAETGTNKPELAADLDKLAAANIPVDIIPQRGKDMVALD
ncbi:hypothetical protein GCM10011369_33900 [Neiella marina]|uniref:Uncharacterized protein n=1 Tax=Neiella marina TaxID=508461 RepID=A0A8J2UA74_9GAMM|nr:hypothetical protein [Neiella marina]GGA88966.1 hypothetical protein GCM10011369_33900 [Neiella marina]